MFFSEGDYLGWKCPNLRRRHCPEHLSRLPCPRSGASHGRLYGEHGAGSVEQDPLGGAAEDQLPDRGSGAETQDHQAGVASLCDLYDGVAGVAKVTALDLDAAGDVRPAGLHLRHVGGRVSHVRRAR